MPLLFRLFLSLDPMCSISYQTEGEKKLSLDPEERSTWRDVAGPFAEGVDHYPK